MSPITVCSTPPILIKVILVMLLVYLVALMGFGGNGRRRHTLAASVMPIVLVPLFAGTSGALLLIGQVMQAAALSGGGRASRAAGVAEAFMMIVIAAGMAATASTIVLLQEVIARVRGKQPAADQSTERGFQMAVVCVAVGLLGWTFALGWIAAHKAMPIRWHGLSVISAAVAGGFMLCNLVWLIVLRRRDVGLQPGFTIEASVSGIITCTLAAIGTWEYVQYFIRIALGR